MTKLFRRWLHRSQPGHGKAGSPGRAEYASECGDWMLVDTALRTRTTATEARRTQ